jgi:hypothetical protein
MGFSGRQSVFKQLVKVAPGTIVIHGAGSVVRPSGQAMAAGSVQAGPFSQGFLPGEMLSGNGLFFHGSVVFAGGTVMIMGTVFFGDHTGLHPDTGPGGL